VNVENIVATLLETDPKEMASSLPTAIELASHDAMAEFVRRCGEGLISSARDADEQANDIAQEACDDHDLDFEDFDEIVADLFKKAAELFPGEW
jgi:hypothetical protein